MAEQGGPIIRKEFDQWKSSVTETESSSLVIKKLNSDVVTFEFDDFGRKFTVTYPEDYPNSSSSFYVHSEDDDLAGWMSDLNDFCDNKNISVAVLCTQLAKTFVKAMAEMEGGAGEDEYGDTGGYEEEDYLEDDYGTEDTLLPDRTDQKIDKVEQEMESKRKAGAFLEIGSASATSRLFQDLKNMKRLNEKDYGFSANPIEKNGKLNLYEWEVRLFGFEGPLAKDLVEYKNKTGKDYIAVSLKFSAEYPFKPPFVRVIEPRFKFRTGHVTLGGAICMELLTLSGWTANNDIESILIQIRAEIGQTGEGGARLEFGSGEHASFQYNESEAWSAFYRAAGNHGWKVEGLGPKMFPSV